MAPSLHTASESRISKPRKKAAQQFRNPAVLFIPSLLQSLLSAPNNCFCRHPVWVPGAILLNLTIFRDKGTETGQRKGQSHTGSPQAKGCGSEEFVILQKRVIHLGHALIPLGNNSSPSLWTYGRVVSTVTLMELSAG